MLTKDHRRKGGGEKSMSFDNSDWAVLQNEEKIR
jgi:hypothetical protein